jgi:quercetin 2,3-dioxygenase
MAIQSARYEPRERLRLIAGALQDLHRRLLEYQRRDYERSFGRIGSDFYLLQLAAEDPAFAWLRVLSKEMMRVDDAISGKTPVTDADLRLVGTRIRHLVLPADTPNSFQSHYDRAMQTMPDVVMAHAGVMRSLPPVNDVRLFRSEPAADIRSDDAFPGVETAFHRPGEMVPGQGDHGYAALAAIAEMSVPGGSEIASRRHANEEVLSWVPKGSMQVGMSAGDRHVVDSERMLVVNAGTGVEVSGRSLAGDQPLRMLQVYVRPAQLQLPPGVQHGPLPGISAGTWRLLAGPEGSDAPFLLHNAIEVMALILATGDEVGLPAKEGRDMVFFVVDGELDVDGVPFVESQSGIVLSPGDITLQARSAAHVLAFLIDPTAKVTRAGTIAR